MKTMRQQLLYTAAAVPMALTMAGGFAVVATVAGYDAPQAYASCNPCNPCKACNPCNPCKSDNQSHRFDKRFHALEAGGWA